MATYKDIIDGLNTFTKYEGYDKHHFAAEHDEVWAGHDTPPDKLSTLEKNRLEKAGWSWDEEVEAWHHYV